MISCNRRLLSEIAKGKPSVAEASKWQRRRLKSSPTVQRVGVVTVRRCSAYAICSRCSVASSGIYAHGKELQSSQNCVSTQLRKMISLLLLEPFVVATDALSGETYPTLPNALPFLRSLREELRKSTLFCQGVGEFGSFDFIEQATEKIEAVRAGFVALLDKRFDKMHDDLVWVSFLDPRLARMTHLSEDEVEGARRRFQSAAVGITIALAQPRSPRSKTFEHHR
ncbi:hypothetical protein PybrP1_008910 [[Pythium] brassicae (nom. inval.)]|nr:hypothetical protein PybrP1_008910 [[Pythium] brassicae (nom. inval.)]